MDHAQIVKQPKKKEISKSFNEGVHCAANITNSKYVPFTLWKSCIVSSRSVYNLKFYKVHSSVIYHRHLTAIIVT